MKAQVMSLACMLTVLVPSCTWPASAPKADRSGCASEARSKAVLRALREPPTSFRCLEWEGVEGISVALTSGDAEGGLGRSIVGRKLRPGLIWCLDGTLSEVAERMPSTDPAKRFLEAGIASTLICMLTEEVSAGQCDGLEAPGILIAAADGWYAEELEEAMLGLLLRRPTRTAACWPRFVAYEDRLSLGTTSFCARSSELLRTYRGRGAVLTFVQGRAGRCR